MIYVKRLLTTPLIVFLLSALPGCTSKQAGTADKIIELRKPPALEILYESKSIHAVRGTYSWTIDNNNGTKTAIHADSGSPTDLVKDTIPLTVPPKSTVSLKFADKPISFTVNIWQNNEITEQGAADNEIIITELKGPIIYEVFADWKQGTACYVFLVNVE